MTSARASLSPAVKRLFQEPNFASIATINRDGTPHVTIVWVDVDDQHVLVNTAEGRVKPRNARRDPRVVVTIFDRQNPYSWASVSGRVIKMKHEGADAHIDKMAKKYLGQDKYPGRAPGEQRVIMIIEPDRVRSSTAG